MNIIRELLTLVTLLLIISVSAILALSGFIISALLGFFLSVIARFRKEEINEHGFVEKTIN